MNKNFLILISVIILIIIFISLVFFEIPSPSKTVIENYQLNVE